MLAPGIYAVHDSSASLNFTGQLTPAAFEALSEIGSPAEAAALVRTLPGVSEVIVVGCTDYARNFIAFEVSVPDG